MDAQCRELYQNQIIIPQDDQDQYHKIRMMRIGIIFFSAILLLINIALIIKRKQYKFNTIKLFMFVQIFYVISLLSVTPHSPDLTFGKCQVIQPPQSPQNFKQDFFNCIIQVGEEYWTAIEGYINMTCYTLSYWFAVCITLYIKHVLENTHKNFMKKRGVLIFSLCLLIGIWFFVPFALAFVEDVPFSFGPAGFKFYSESEYFFYGGIINRDGSLLGQTLVIVWMLILPLSLFIYHIYLLCRNNGYIKRLITLDDITPRQFFIIKSGRLSFVIFFVQIFNVAKLVFSLFLLQTEDNHTSQIILFIMNVTFDLMPVILIFIYFRHYYREGRDLQERSTSMESDRSLLSSLARGSVI